MIVTDYPGVDQILFKFLAEQTGLPWSTDLRVIGVMQGLAVRCAVGYNCWLGDGVFMHVAFRTPNSLTRELLREAFVYPFITCDKRVVYGMTPITNEAAIKFNKKLGFVEVNRTSDFVLFEMKREDCRWVNGKEKQSASGT